MSTTPAPPPQNPTLANILLWLTRIANSVIPAINQAHADWTNQQKVQAILDIVQAAADTFSEAEPQYAGLVTQAITLVTLGVTITVAFYSLFHHPKAK
jgi:glutathione S-transferase